MTFIIWFIVIAALTLGSVAFVRSKRFQKALLPKKKRKAVEPVKVKTLYEVHKEDHRLWLAEYRAIFQKNCDHLYHDQKWATCMLCGYEEPWHYEEGCGCTYAETSKLTDLHPTYALINRASWCKVHGRDFKLFPISDRKRGPYGPQSDQAGAVERSRELTTGRSMRRIDSDIEGTH